MLFLVLVSTWVTIDFDNAEAIVFIDDSMEEEFSELLSRCFTMVTNMILLIRALHFNLSTTFYV